MVGSWEGLMLVMVPCSGSLEANILCQPAAPARDIPLLALRAGNSFGSCLLIKGFVEDFRQADAGPLELALDHLRVTVEVLLRERERSAVCAGHGNARVHLLPREFVRIQNPRLQVAIGPGLPLFRRDLAIQTVGEFVPLQPG